MSGLSLCIICHFTCIAVYHAKDIENVTYTVLPSLHILDFIHHVFLKMSQVSCSYGASYGASLLDAPVNISATTGIFPFVLMSTEHLGEVLTCLLASKRATHSQDTMALLEEVFLSVGEVPDQSSKQRCLTSQAQWEADWRCGVGALDYDSIQFHVIYLFIYFSVCFLFTGLDCKLFLAKRRVWATFLPKARLCKII